MDTSSICCNVALTQCWEPPESASTLQKTGNDTNKGMSIIAKASAASFIRSSGRNPLAPRGRSRCLDRRAAPHRVPCSGGPHGPCVFRDKDLGFGLLLLCEWGHRCLPAWISPCISPGLFKTGHLYCNSQEASLGPGLSSQRWFCEV